MVCADGSCDRQAESRGLCDKHYRRARNAKVITNLPRATGAGTTCTVDGCTSEVESAGLCTVHRSRKRKTGGFDKRTRANGEAFEIIRNGSLAVGAGPCVMLENPSGARPMTTLNGVFMAASRAAWIMANGDPGTPWVLHTCGRGVQGCVRIGHMYLGTGYDNAVDRSTDGVQNMGRQHHNAKLTEEQVREIRATPRRLRSDPVGTANFPTLHQLAIRYSVSVGTIRNVVERRGWKHVTV